MCICKLVEICLSRARLWICIRVGVCVCVFLCTCLHTSLCLCAVRLFAWLCPQSPLTAVEAAHLHLESRRHSPLLPRSSQLDPAHVATVPVMYSWGWRARGGQTSTTSSGPSPWIRRGGLFDVEFLCDLIGSLGVLSLNTSWSFSSLPLSVLVSQQMGARWHLC